MTHFSDLLIQKTKEKKTPICLGLDPHFNMLPDCIKKGKTEIQAIKDFLFEIIEATHDKVAICKPNIAFFEEWGAEGLKVFEEVCEKAKEKELLVLVDAKRGDIGSTCEAYARAFLTYPIYDALTINPYFGEDGIKPFLKYASKNNKGLFCLVKTSNPTGGEFQDLMAGEYLVHEHVAHAVSRWGADYLGESKFSLLGAVVGATYIDDIHILRQDMPSQVFLIPGYGAQGGKAKDLFAAFYKDGKGAIINSSRKILFASKEKDFAAKAREELIASNEEFLPIWKK